MSELKNEFSWSKTRDEVFKTCHRERLLEDNGEGLDSYVRKEGKA
jgi:hypothetical protein